MQMASFLKHRLAEWPPPADSLPNAVWSKRPVSQKVVRRFSSGLVPANTAGALLLFTTAASSSLRGTKRF